MMLYRSYRFRLYPTAEQEELIQKTFGCVRYVYNYFLKQRIKLYETNKENTTFFKQCKELTILKKENPWLKEADKNALQIALKNLHKAYSCFFRDMKNKKSCGLPKYKSKKEHYKSYSSCANNKLINVEGKFVRLPKLGLVRAKFSKVIPQDNKIINATVSQHPSGKYFVTIMVEYNIKEKKTEVDREKSLGLDYSSGHFYVDSENQIADMPHFYRIFQQKLGKEQRKLSHMQYGSKNWEKQCIRVARLHEKIKNQRNDWQHKLSTELANKYDIIGVEDINFQDLSHVLHLSKATNDNSFGQFRLFLEYKLAERGKMLIKVNKWFPSSKTCRFCGNIYKELTVKERKWRCKACGMEINRDLNAAINIRNYALSII